MFRNSGFYKIFIQNFRKLHRCVIELGEQKTLFVGANNSGKTSAMTALSKFLVKEDSFKFNDFTVSHRATINAIGEVWQKDDERRRSQTLYDATPFSSAPVG